MKMKLMILGMAGLVAATTAVAQTELESEPGYVDLDTMESWFGEEPYVFVSVKGVLLNLVAEASAIEDPDLADLLRKVKAVQVRGFKSGHVDKGELASNASRFVKDLERKGWEAAVRVRDEEEHVDLLLRSRGSSIAGLMIVVANEEDEAVFVNIVGDIDPSQVARLGRKFDIDELDRDW